MSDIEIRIKALEMAFRATTENDEGRLMPFAYLDVMAMADEISKFIADGSLPSAVVRGTP